MNTDSSSRESSKGESDSEESDQSQSALTQDGAPTRVSWQQQGVQESSQAQKSRRPQSNQGRGVASGLSHLVNVDEKDSGWTAERKGYDGSDMSRTSEVEDLSKLRAAVNARLSSQQTRPRPRQSMSGGTMLGTARVSPIKEESSTPPKTLDATEEQASGPHLAGRTASTISTASTESQRTVRGGGSTGAQTPLRTPSYPFPYVPGTPRAWSGGFHQPFTNLSPTVSGSQPRDRNEPRRANSGLGSSVNIPSPMDAFSPPEEFASTTEDSHYPSPNVYNLSLQLHAEPGLEEWWANLTNILHDHFKADRATLIMPTDSSDIENCPWGLKATFSMNGPEEFVSHSIVEAQTAHAQARGQQRPDLTIREPSSEAFSENRPQILHPERLRPRLEARHSYAGHGQRTAGLSRDVRQTSLAGGQETHNKATQRPAGPQRHMTYTADTIGQTPPPRAESISSQTTANLRHTALSDPDFSSVAGGIDVGPYANVYSALRALNRENRPLIEPSGINRVLQRGRVVTVIRDYSSDSSERSVDPSSAPSATMNQDAIFGDYRSVFSSDNIPSIRRDYEEYEQHPCSPWAQSPAPSPAMQADEERNPFFASEEQQVEDSFNPAVSPRDYSQELQVEAIGIDCASTVIHIPLIHPKISQPMQSLRMTPPSKNHTNPGNLQRSNTVDLQRMAPIAILSVLTSVVPYPNNLVHSLRLLGPHLATSLSIAQQFNTFRGQAVRIRHRVPDQGETVVTAPMTVELMSIEDVVNTGFRRTSDMNSDAVTSPSEYSGRSKNSPPGSFSSTPGWDMNASGMSYPRSAAGTPSLANERNSDYFETQKRLKRGSQGVNSTQGSSSRSAQHNTDGQNTHATEESFTAGENTHQQSRQPSQSKDDKSQQVVEFMREEQTPTSSRSARPTMAHLPEYVSHSKPHTLLHSYGADFESSFGGLSTATPGEASHTRRASHSVDMPPPSERLLRLIIDSVPVQIFTAQPESGQLSWVNAKLLNYRGQDSRQVLKNPWQAIHPDDHAEFISVWHRSLRTTQQMSQKVRMRNKEGKYRWFYVKCLPLKTPQQKVVHWIGTMMDFHEQHMAEVKIAHQKETEVSQAKYKALANSSPQIVFSAQKAKGITFCNTQWLQYSGQTEREALGQGFLEHVHPDDLVKCRFPIFEDGSAEPVNVPTSIPAEPRRTISASAMSSGASSETEKPSSGSDSTVSPTSQTTAIMPQRKLSELASIGILKVSRDTDGRPSYSTEVRLKSKGGKFRWHLVRVLLAEAGSQDNDEGTWYGTCTDINDHKTLERDLKETMDEKSRFLSNMSHEIRTPLNGITGMVNFLMDSNLTSEQMEHVNIIRTSTEGLRGLINDILDLSKAEAGMITLKKDWLYPRALIEEVNDLTSTMAIDKGLELNYLVDEDVPPIIKGDKFRIRQILLNTVGNAIKFTQKGEVFVRCSQLPDEDGVLKSDEIFIKFDVIDTGRGFTEQEAKFLFKRFSQIDGSSTRQHGGSGLGLVISRQLAQLHGGDMSASGIPNKGSTFTFVIQAGLMSEKERLPSVPSDEAPALESSVYNAERPNLKALPSLTKTSSSSVESRHSSEPGRDVTGTPSHLSSSPDAGKQSSPSVSSASSDPSVRSAARSGSGSVPSARSSASSFIPETATMKLSLPLEVRRPSSTLSPSPKSDMSDQTAKQSTVGSPGLSSPPMFSILVVASLEYSQKATVQHITKTLPKNVPHQITARASPDQCRGLLGGIEPVIFSHVVINLQDVTEIIALMKQVLGLNSSTSVVLISDLAQRKQIIEQAPDLNYDHLTSIRRLMFIFKPLKPSRLGLIFDPQKEREMSTDRNQDSAKQVATNQKQVFQELTSRLGNRDKRVLIVEDNRTNLLVILKFFSKSAIQVETVFDGVQCTDKVFAMPPGYFSMILCDLHMPNKDGYQTCREIRKWEKKNKHRAVPIIALSANVLDDVYEKCVAAGFNDYMTKPVDFKELKHVLLRFMDPQDPTQPHELMKVKSGESSASASR